jgi:serine/threonine-protein kinase
VSPRARRALRDLAIILGAGASAWGLAVLWTAPAPLFSSDHAVPRVLELGLAEAQRRITAAGFRPRFAGTEQHPVLAAGRVVAQDPPAGVVLPPGSAVAIVTSSGTAPVVVPDVVGFGARAAARVIEAAGLRAATVDSVREGADAPGVVVATRPAAGGTEDPGSTVGLVVSAATAGTP